MFWVKTVHLIKNITFNQKHKKIHFLAERNTKPSHETHKN